MFDIVVDKLMIPLTPFHPPLYGLNNVWGVITELHNEVQFCLWSINVSLSVYLQLLNVVDLDTRRGVSDKICSFLADSGDTDALSALISSECAKYNIVPNMAMQNHKALIPTIASYLKALSSDGLDPLEYYIGRPFFPRLEVVSRKILELLKAI
jgi:hypothetical protein